MIEPKVIVYGLTELQAALTKVTIEVNPALSKELKALAGPVKQQAQQAALAWSAAGAGQATTAGGMQIRRRLLNVRVEQSLSKTTGKHPNYGGVQMRDFLIPALDANQSAIQKGVSQIIDNLTDI